MIRGHWNSLAKKHGLPTLSKMTEERKRKYKARTDQGRDQLGFWKTLERELSRLNDFARGVEEGSNWRISFDYIVRSESTITKLEEGGFRNTKAKAPRTPGANTNRLDLA
jgi:DNA-binding PadR family transcriptional regulator